MGEWFAKHTKADLAARIEALEADNARLREALKPFADFASARGFDRIPPDLPMTQGSNMARRQVTAGDFITARAAQEDNA